MFIHVQLLSYGSQVVPHRHLKQTLHSGSNWPGGFLTSVSSHFIEENYPSLGNKSLGFD